MTFKRFLSLVTALIMALSSMPLTAFASETSDVEVVVHSHAHVLTAETAPSCTGSGSLTYTCECGDSYTEAIGPTGHSYSESVTDATCTASGSVVKTCSNCGDTQSAEIPALGHSYAETIVEATCTAEGSKTRTCSTCGDTTTEVIPALDHNYVETIVEATCIAEGSKTLTCSNCGDTTTEVLPVAEHSYVETIVEATCTAEGSKTLICSNCGDTTTEVLPLAEHSFEEDVDNSIEATCTEEGSLVKVCTVCGEIETEVVEMAEHDYVDGICSVCGAIDLEVAVKAGPAGTLSSSLVDLSDPAKTFITAEITDLNATESVVIKLYDAYNVHLATTTLLNQEYYTASQLIVEIIITGSSTSWSTVWEEGKLRADYVPAYAELYVDGFLVSQANVPMVSTNGEATVNWAEVPGVQPVPAEEPSGLIDSYDALVAALANGGEIKLDASITIDNRITVPDGTVIDLNGNTLYLNVEESYVNNATIKNGNIVLGKDDVHICNGYFNINPDKTLTLNGVSVTSDGYKGYTIFHLYESADLNLESSTINVANNEFAGSIVYADNGNACVTVTDSSITGENVGGSGFIHATIILNNSSVTLKSTVEKGMEHGINRSGLTLNNSSVTVSGGWGRGLTAQHGDIVVNGTSSIRVTDMDEATIELRSNRNLTIADTATVVVENPVNNTTSGKITGKVTVLNPYGSITPGYTSQTAVWGEGGGNAKESFDVELYVGDTKIATSSLNNIGGIIDGDVYVTWFIHFAGSTDEYWTVEWEEGYPNANEQPTKVVMIIDGVKVAENDVQMNAPDDLNPVVWKDLEFFKPDEAAIGDKGYKKLADAVANAQNGDTITLLTDATLSEMLKIPEGRTLTLDLNEKTVTGSILAPNADLTVQNGSIVNNDSSVSAIEINAGELDLVNVNIDSARHAIRIDGAVTANINGGTYRSAIGTGKGTFHAANISGAANVTIENGTFVGPKGTVADSGAAVNVQSGANVTIKGGSYSGGKNNTLAAAGTLVVTGGTFDQDPTAYVDDQEYVVKGSTGAFSVVRIPVAKVGNTEYGTIDEAVANWTNGTTLTLLADVTLSDVITLKSTEHHILDLGTFTMTAASGKHAIEITCNGLSSATYAITVNADAENPGGITATGKSCIYYKKSGTTKDRPIIRIYGGVFNGSYSINTTSNGNTNCPQVWTYGGTFNGNVNLTKTMLRAFGGTFNGWVNCTGDSSAYRLISGGTYKSWQFMTADDNNTKFWVGTSMTKSDVGVYVDDNGYLVVGGPIITEVDDRFEASTAYDGWSPYLKYSSAATYGLFYTSVAEALADTNKASGVVTVYEDKVDLSALNYKGTIMMPEGTNELTVTFTEGTKPAWTVKSSEEGKTVIYTDVVENGVVTRNYKAIVPVAQIGDQYFETLTDAVAAAQDDDVIVMLADVEFDTTIVNTKTITIDLNGKSITGKPSVAKAYSVIKNTGNLTIDDTVDGGGIYCDHQLTGSTAYAVNTITNGGVLTINNGTIENKSTESNQIGYAIDNNSTSANAIVTINGGDVKASGSGYYDGIRLFANSTTLENSVTVNGGSVSSIWMQNPSDGNSERNTKDVKGSISITGGSVNALYTEPSSAFSASITGGHVGSVSSFETSEGRDLTGFISGGTFTTKPDDSLLVLGYVFAQADGVYGVEKDPKNLYITNLDELKDFRDSVNDGTTYNGVTVHLMADIDLNSEEWTPIGNSSNKFQGTFDGHDHTISNLVITGNNSNVGLFGYTTVGEVKNLTVNNAKVSGRLNVGVLAGTPFTTKYTNIKVTGHVEVNGMAYVGGVGGKNAYANWTNVTVDVDDTSYVKGDSVENGDAYRTYVGGVIGFMGEGNHTFQNITSNIDVIGTVQDVGGITGIAHYGNNFIDITCTGDVTNTSSDAGEVTETGGIAGVWHDGGSAVTFENLTYTGTVSTPNAGDVVLPNGGLIGAAYSINNPEKSDGSGSIDGDVAIVNGKSYATLDAAIAAAGNGDTVSIIADGTYVLPAIQNKQLTIEAADKIEVTIDMAGKTPNFSGTQVVFNGLNFAYSNANYTGIQHVDTIVYNNCTFTGQPFLYGNAVTFNGCEFTQESPDAYNVWTYGAKEVTFKDCTFNSAGKSVLVYNEGGPATHLVVNNTAFNASNPVSGKAAIEIDTTAPKKPGAMDGTTIEIDDKTTATGFATGSISGETLWNDKKDQTNLIVYVDDEIVWPASKADMTYSAYGFTASGEGEKYRERFAIDLYRVYARESLKVELYSGDTLVATTTKRATDRDDGTVFALPITGSTTVNVVVAGRPAGSWDTTWHVAPSVSYIPDTAKIYADGKLVDTYTDAFDAEDEALYAALPGVAKAASVTDSEGNVTYYGTLADAFAAAQAGDTVELLQNITVTEQIKVTDNSVLSDITFDGNNFTITADLNQDNQSVLYMGDTSGSWATGVKVKDVTITGTARFGIMLVGGTESELTNVTIEGDYIYGINFYGTHGATMTDCNVVTVFTNGQDDYPLNLVNSHIDHLFANKSDATDGAKVFIDENSSVDELTFWGDASIMIDPASTERITKINEAVAEIDGIYYKTLQAAIAAAGNGDTVSIIADGTYVLPSIADKQLTIEAADKIEVTIDMAGKIPNFGGTQVVFNGLNFAYSNATYTGIQHVDTIVYNNCTFTGQPFLYGNAVTFNGCEFTQTSKDAYNVWTYGAKEVTFKDCTFNSEGKAVLVYNEGATANHVVFNDCELIANAPVDGKAAIEINTSYPGMTGTKIEINNTTATGFATGSISGETLWNDKENQTNLSVFVDSKLVWPIPELPTATVTELEKADLTFALNFKADEATDAQLNYYGDWYADFVLTVSKDATFNANGGADGWLSGQYDLAGPEWINVPETDVTMKAGESLKIMEYAAGLMGAPGLKLTYKDVYGYVKDFDCGVFFTNKYLKNNQDLVVTLELRMYNPADESESYVIGETYTFQPEGLSADMTYSAYGFSASGEGEKYRERFAIDLYKVYARESLSLELYSGDTLVATTTYREFDRDDESAVFARPITGSKTVNVVVAGRLAGSWDTEWHVAPSVSYIPDTVKVYADGVLVDTYTDAFDAEDKALYSALPGVAKVASVTDSEGNVTYYGSIADAAAATQNGDTITILASTDETLSVPAGDNVTYTADEGVELSGGVGGSYWNKSTTFDGLNFVGGKGIALTAGVTGLTYTVTNCTFTGVQATAWKQGVISLNGKAEVVVTGNTITDVANATEGDGRIESQGQQSVGVYVSGATSVTISDNTISGVDGTGINVACTGTMTVTDNTISDWGTGATAKNEGRAIRTSGGSDVKITGNVMIDNGTAQESFVKATGATGTLDISENHWNGDSPLNGNYMESDKSGDPVSILLNYYEDAEKTNLIWLETSVAKIGEKYYASIDAAAEAAGEGDVIVLLKDVELTAPVALGEDVTLSLNGNQLTGNVVGKLAMAGGSYITGEGFKMVAPMGTEASEGYLYYSNDGVFNIVSLADITIEAGEVELAQSWRTLPGQKVTVAEDASFTVPAGMKFEILGNATVNGILKIKETGEVVLADASATLTAEEGLNVTTSVADHKVVYEDDMYKVVAKVYVAQIGETKYESLADAIAAVQNGETIILLADNDEIVTIKQTANKSFTIDGDGKTYTGTININGNRSSTGAETLTIQNMNFVAEGQWQSSIFAEKNTYVHNLTVDNCTFTGTDAKEAYGIRLHHAYNITVKNTTGTKLYDLVYAQTAVTGFTAENIQVTESGMGFMMPYGMKMSFKDVTLNVSGAGVGIYNNNASTATFENCDFTASPAVHLEQKNTTNAYTLIFNGTNNFSTINVVGSDAMLKAVVNDATIVDDNFTGMVAKIDNVYYNTLANALKEAQAGDTVELVTDVELSEALILGEDITLSLNGNQLTGNVVGKLAMAGGTYITAEGHNMVAPVDAEETFHYLSDDAVFVIEANGDITIAEGDVKLGESWHTLEGQTLTVAEGASFTVPADMTFDVYSTAIVEEGGTLIVDGTVVLKIKDATLEAVEGLNVITDIADHKVVYEDGVYKVAEKVYAAQIGEVKYEDFFEALEAADEGDTITLLQPIVLKEDKEVDLKGLTVDCVEDVYPAFRIQNEANVTFQNGTVTNSDYVFVLGASDGSSAGNLTIKDGNYKGETTVASVTKGTLTIEGGEFAVEPYEGSYDYLLNCIDANYKDGTAKIEVKGGTFSNFDPANNAAEGVDTDFVAEGYVSVDNGDGTWTVKENSPIIHFKAMEVSVDSEQLLRLKFIIDDEFFNDQGAYAILTEEANAIKPEQSRTLTAADIKAMGTDANGRYVFEQGVAAAEMTGDVTVKFYNGEGELLYIDDYSDPSVPKTEIVRTVVDYAHRILEVGNTKQKALATAMVTYGGYAQQFFKVDTSNLAYDMLNEFGLTPLDVDSVSSADIEDELKVSGDEIGITYKSQQAVLESSVYMRTYFVLEDGKDIGSYTFKITAPNGSVKTVTPMLLSDGRYAVDITDIPVARWDNEYVITISDANGGKYEVSSSVMAYVKRGLNAFTNPAQIATLQAMVLYNEEANSFFPGH